MPKPFGMVGGKAPMAAPNVRPMPRPVAIGGTAPAMTQGQRPAMTPERLQMIQALLSGVVQSAADSGSPILAALAPIAGAFIGNSATKRFEDGKAAQSQASLQAVLGDRANDPQLQGILSVLNDEKAPGYLKEIARKQFDALVGGGAATGGGRASGGGGRRRSGGGGRGSAGGAGVATGADGPRGPLTHIQTDADGRLVGFDKKTNKMWPVEMGGSLAAGSQPSVMSDIGAPGQFSAAPAPSWWDKINPFGGAEAAAPTEAPLRRPTPFSQSDDDLLGKYGAL